MKTEFKEVSRNLTMESSIEKIQVSLDRNVCEMQWKDSHVSRFHAKWLRFNCHCSRCKAKFSGEYRIDTLTFPDHMVIVSASVSDEECRFEFEEEPFMNHVTWHPADWLREKCYCDKCLERKLEESDVITRKMKENQKKRTRAVPAMDYKEILDDKDRGVFKMLSNIVESGICLLRGVPATDKKVLEIVELIAYVEKSTYGEVFEVLTEKTPINAAYSAFKLPMHQDQLQYENGPGLQILHAIKFDSCVGGGESTFRDVFEAAETLKKESPEDFQTLVEVPAVFTTVDFDRSIPVCMNHQKCHISLDYFGKIVGVNWHPALTDALQVREGDVDRYYKAHSRMLEIVRREEFKMRFRLKEGDMVLFNNRRMLHAREAFQLNGGERHLQGTYIKLDEVKSKYLVLANKLENNVCPPKIGNNSSM